MSSKIDERIVGMRFNGDQFQKGVADTSRSLEKLKSGLDLKGASKGLNDLDAAGKNFSLANLANGVQDIASRFGAMSIIGITALANIASKAVDVGLTMAKSMTIDPLKSGLAEYELKMGSIQTILSNTARYGTSLGEVTGALDELNTYADKTIYNFGDMTKNIGLFTNAGLRVEEATSMIKGFSNEAASSGTNAQGAASAAYQLSQALSAGTIRLMDWRSLQNVGMGNKNMQNGLIEIADAMGTLEENSISATDVQKDFNGSLEKNWLSADVMSSYLKIMAGDMTAAEQAALGLSDAQIAAFQKQQIMSEEAATKVRTFTQLVGTMQESVGSGWAQTFDILIGDFNQATDLWTAVNDELGAMVGKQSEERNKLLQGFVEVGGRDDIIAGIASIWQAVQMYIMPIKSAFQEIFPPTTVATLKVLSTWFKNFAESLKPTGKQMAVIKRIFMGVFALLDIGWMVLKEVIGLFGDLFGVVGEGSGDFLEMVASFSDWVVGARNAIKEGEGLGKVFDWLRSVFTWLGDAIKKPFELLGKFGEMTIDFLSVESWAQAWENVGNALRKVGEFFEPVLEWIGEAVTNTKKVLGDFFKEMDFNVLVGLLNVGAIGGVGFLIKKGFDKLLGAFESGPGGIIDTIKGVFGAVTDTFGTLQDTLKAGTLKKIAIAIAILVASVIALSFVDTGKLFISLGAMAIMFGMLSGMLMVMDKFMSKFDAGQLAALAGSMTIIAAAMLILSFAISIMGNLEWDELARGLLGLALGLGALLNALDSMSRLSGSMVKNAAALTILSVAMILVATAVKIFSTMNWEELAKGVGGFAVTLGVMVGALSLLKKEAVGIGMLLALAGSMLIISGAMKMFATMSWDEILRSMTVFGGAVLILVGALTVLSLFGKLAPVGAAVLLAMAVAMNILVPALKAFGDMSWESIGKAMVVLAGSLAILAGAMALFGIPIVLLGSIGILAAATAMMILAPALVLLGGMPWDDIGRGLTMLGASLLILAVGGLLMIPASVGFLLLGVAVLALGAGVLMAAQGVALFALSITALAAAAAIGSEAIKMSLQVIIDMIPAAMAAFAQGLIDFAMTIAGGAIEFTAAATTLIQAMIAGINNNAPQIIDTIWNLIMQLNDKVVENVPIFVDSGMKLIIGIIEGINRNIDRLIDEGTKLVVKFITGIGRSAGIIAAAGADTVIKFVNSLANTIETRSAEMRDAGMRLAGAIINGMTGGLFNGVGDVIRAAANVAGRALQAAKNFLGIKSPSREFFKVGAWSTEGMAKGLVKTAPVVEKASSEVGKSALTAMRESLDGLKNAVATDMQFQPTIRPIMDLSSVRQGAKQIDGMWHAPNFRLKRSDQFARSVADATDQNYEGWEEGDDPSGNTYIFNQNNNSPKAISSAEMYRQGKNLLSTIKKEQPTK